MNKRLALLTGAITTVLLIPSTIVFAQGFENLIDLALDFQELISIITVVIIGLALVFFLWGLAIFILSAGDEEKRAQGKKVMIWGVVAFAVMVGVWGLVNFLLAAFDLDTTVPDAPGIPEV